jgi:hypothetical protein
MNMVILIASVTQRKLENYLEKNKEKESCYMSYV